ncbi:Aste57867_742 [Aphanomyces stellatus]|uniref:Aste57867_742 protein n=1 Tax=Aphanomyces stellatus TaxID=120398 RepID=A0A485K3R7_9STRA|nr:hypothetical protein As57867_000741 [Aphanomyces stellatus]VFT77966.1 Aste57867_742 [Aphanomyces stellatus]
MLLMELSCLDHPCTQGETIGTRHGGSPTQEDVDAWLDSLPKSACISNDLRSRLAAYVTVDGLAPLLTILASTNIEDQLIFLFELYHLPPPPSFVEKPSHAELAPFHRHSFLSTSSQREISVEMASDTPANDNVHELRNVLIAGMYLTHANCRLESADQLPSVQAICLVLTECRLLYVSRGTLEKDEIVLIVRRYFHHGIFRWSVSTTSSPDSKVAFQWNPNSNFI